MILLKAGLEHLAGHACLQEDAQVVTKIPGLQIGAVDPLPRGDLHDPGLAQKDLQGKRVDRGPPE